jgi:hypothetical protein
MFDAGFNKYLTLTIIKIVWAISIALAILTAIGGIIYGFIGTSGEPVFNEAGDVVAEGERTPSYLTVVLADRGRGLAPVRPDRARARRRDLQDR